MRLLSGRALLVVIGIVAAVISFRLLAVNQCSAVAKISGQTEELHWFHETQQWFSPYLRK